jgi:hypothetical protein
MTIIEGEVMFMRRDAFDVDKAATIKNAVNICRTDHLSIPTPPSNATR